MTKKKESINPLREAQRELWFFVLMLRQKYELHSFDIPDILEGVSTKWFIENCVAEFKFKEHGIDGYIDATYVYRKPVEKAVEEPLAIPTMSSGLFRVNKS